MAKNWLCLASALLMAFLLAACGGGGGTRDSIATSTVLAPPDTTSASGAYQGASDYRIGAQDLLQISVFGVKDLDKDVRVNSNGQISLPLIGGVMAGGKSIPELEAELAKKYAGFLQKPQVTVREGIHQPAHHGGGRGEQARHLPDHRQDKPCCRPSPGRWRGRQDRGPRPASW